MLTRGIPAEKRHYGDTFVSDAANGMNIYRANFFRSLGKAGRDRYVEVPVQVIVNLDDPLRAPVRLRRHLRAGFRGCGAATSAPGTGRRSRIRRCWPPPSPNWPSTSTASRPAARCCAPRSAGRARSSATRWCRSPERAAASGARPRWRSPAREPNWSSATSTRQASRRPSRRSARAAASRTPTCSTCPTPRPSSGSPAKCVPPTVCPTSSSTTPASGWPGRSSTPRPSNSTRCSTSTSAVWSTAAGPSPGAWSSAAPAATSSTSPRWRPTRRCSRSTPTARPRLRCTCSPTACAPNSTPPESASPPSAPA